MANKEKKIKGKYKKRKKKEWSKLVCALIMLYGVANGVMYWVAVMHDKMPDASLATQCVITIIGAYFSYLLYQFGLKNSRNKYGVDAEGMPYNPPYFEGRD